MILAAIDIGTNSTKMLVARVSGQKVSPLLHRAIITRLGEGLQRSGELSPEAIERTVKAVAELRAIATEKQAEKVAAVGTLALRAARNPRDFLDRCAREAGVEVRVISGEEEARLSFLGASGASSAEQVLGIEIGGGSTQIMIGTHSKVHASWSLGMGAVTMTEEFLKSDPPVAEEMRAMSAAIKARLQEVVARVGKSGELVGIGGTVSAILALLRNSDGGDPRDFSRVPVPFEMLSALAIKLSLKTVAEREALGLEKGRADVIVGGAWILTAAMSHLEAGALRATTSGLRHGLLIEMASGARPC